MDIKNVLEIVKQDLLIKSNVRDEYLTTIIKSCVQELRSKGIIINDSVSDTLLVADLTAFRYRHRADNSPMPQNLQHRIQNKKTQGRLYRD